MSVGGSLIVPDKINTAFLKKLKKFILEEIKNERKFVIITGGGKTARNYQEAANKICHLQSEDVDWLGIHATRLNGHLLRTIFHEIAHKTVIKNPNKKIKMDSPVLIAAGWKPGWSTDYVAVKIARNIGATKLVNLSNIDYVYDKDPNKYKNAEKIKNIEWKSFRKLLPKNWDPGLSSPFDPVAARDAEKSKMEIAIINGSRLNQIKKYLNKEKFIGTLIK